MVCVSPGYQHWLFAVLGIVGAGGIGYELMRASRLADYGQALGVTLLYF